RHSSGCHNAQVYLWRPRLSKRLSRSNRTPACNTPPDNNRCHTSLRKGSLHIRPEKLPRRLRTGSTAVMNCACSWFVFSSDIPFLDSEFPFLFHEIADANSGGLLSRSDWLLFRPADLYVRFELRGPIGCRSGSLHCRSVVCAVLKRIGCCGGFLAVAAAAAP